VLLQEHAAKLGQPVGRIVESAKDLLTLDDRQRDSDAISVESGSQTGRRRLIDEVSERLDELGGHRDACDDENHVGRIALRNVRASLALLARNGWLEVEQDVGEIRIRLGKHAKELRSPEQRRTG
jgi:hypothetical protein